MKAKTKKKIFLILVIGVSSMLALVWLWLVYDSVFRQLKDASGF